MQDVAFEWFSFGRLQNCIVFIDVDDFVGPFKIGGQLLVLLRKLLTRTSTY